MLERPGEVGGQVQRLEGEGHTIVQLDRAGHTSGAPLEVDKPGWGLVEEV